jgi:hypothetical protein
LPVTPTNKDYTFITFDGATQLKASYSLSGNLITFSENTTNSSNVALLFIVLANFDII